jgi:23S rRNA (guanosine2251-2'-O)-methyltransferase
MSRRPPRQEYDVLYGRNPIHEALRAGRRPVHRIWATPAAATEPWLQGRKGVQVAVGDAEWIAARAGSDAHQGMVADVGPYPYANPGELLAARRPFLVVLDEVQDPQNVGAIARSAECAGATGLVLGRHRSAEVTPAVCKASAGAVEHLPVAVVRNIADYLREAKQAGTWVYGAAADGVDYRRADFGGAGVVLVMGAEGRGLRPRVRETCDALVSLPLRGRIDSLNVGAAAAVLLYAISPAFA